MIGADITVLIGEIQMKNLRKRSMSMTACVLGSIPCISPCCVLGIPFGIWGLVVLNDPQVRRAFSD